MNRRREGSDESFLSILIGIVILLAGAAAVFYAAYKVSYVSVDYGIHVGIAEELDWSDPVQMLKEHPEPVWHILVRIAMKICRVNAQRAAGFVSGGLCALTYLIAAHFLHRAVGKGALKARDTAVNLSVKASAAASPGSASGLSLIGVAVFTWLLSISSAIFVPWFNDKPYLGQGSPNPWHNPTTIMVRPIALLIFILVMGECVRVQRGGFRKGQGLRIWKGFLLALLLLLSNLSKPSFVQIFYPAIFLLMFLWLFVYRFRNFPLGMQLLLCCVPSVALMGLQFISAFYGNTNEDSAGVVFAPFKVAGIAASCAGHLTGRMPLHGSCSWSVWQRNSSWLREAPAWPTATSTGDTFWESTCFGLSLFVTTLRGNAASLRTGAQKKFSPFSFSSWEDFFSSRTLSREFITCII